MQYYIPKSNPVFAAQCSLERADDDIEYFQKLISDDKYASEKNLHIYALNEAKRNKIFVLNTLKELQDEKSN